MAPRFKQNMYQTYKKETGIEALICFAKGENDLIFAFRDRLFKRIAQAGIFFVQKSEGEPTPIDSRFQLFAKEHEDRMKTFSKRKPPSIFASVFRTKGAREFDKEQKEVIQLAKFDMDTSHDYPCIVIRSLLHSEAEISRLIDEAAAELNVEMTKNRNLPPISDIIMTNRSFRIEES